MIDYLENYNISLEELDLIEDNLTKDMALNFKIMQDNVIEILDYLKEIGIKRISNVILYRPDLCFMTIEDLKLQFKKIDTNLLVYIINNSIDDLTCFNI